MKLSERQINVAVEWWADRLRNPTFQTLSPQERVKKENEPAALSEMLATLGAMPKYDEQVEQFKFALRSILEDDLPSWGLMVDYHPDQTLSAALFAAGIKNDIMVLPWKTYMRFDNGGVQASCGYGNPTTELLK